MSFTQDYEDFVQTYKGVKRSPPVKLKQSGKLRGETSALTCLQFKQNITLQIEFVSDFISSKI
eukprot:3655914-Amphidinium_carterae.1